MKRDIFKNGVKVGEEYSDPPVVLANKVYTGPGLWRALDSAEQVLLINKSKASDAAGAIFESIKLNGLDFNQSDDFDIGDRMVVAGILTQSRLDELAG